jgi:release factor glutamine methyltransferase
MKDPVGAELLAREADTRERLSVWLARWRAGEPAPYIAGVLQFRGRRFRSDRRAYITDPELTHLVDAVLAEGDRLELVLGRAPTVLEFGVGGGTLAISVKLERPHWTVQGLDVDPGALELAAENAAWHGVTIGLIQSDLLAAWTDAAPDLLFGDPPWGGADDLSDAERDARYYAQMPIRSAFPGGTSVTELHDRLLAEVAARAWPTTVLLNYGVLDEARIHRSAAPLERYQILVPQDGVRVLRGWARAHSAPV